MPGVRAKQDAQGFAHGCTTLEAGHGDMVTVRQEMGETLGESRRALWDGEKIDAAGKDGLPAAQDETRLWLLPSGPDQVHGPPVHRARPCLRRLPVTIPDRGRGANGGCAEWGKRTLGTGA